MNLKKIFIILLGSAVIFFMTCPKYGQSGALREAAALGQEAVRLYKQGRYAEAIPYAERVLAMRENILGSGHPPRGTLSSFAEQVQPYRGGIA